MPRHLEHCWVILQDDWGPDEARVEGVCGTLPVALEYLHTTWDRESIDPIEWREPYLRSDHETVLEATIAPGTDVERVVRFRIQRFILMRGPRRRRRAN